MPEAASVTEHDAIVAASFDDRAPGYDNSVMHRGVAKAVAEFAFLENVGAALDVATGTGLVLRELDARQPGLTLVGVDISPGMLAVARGALPKALFVESSAHRLPLKDASFDLVTCATAMHLMADPGSVFAEFARVLTPRGRLVLATFQLTQGRAPAKRSYRTNHRDFETAERIEAVAGPRGFKVTRTALGQYEDDLCLLTELSM